MPSCHPPTYHAYTWQQPQQQSDSSALEHSTAQHSSSMSAAQRTNEDHPVVPLFSRLPRLAQPLPAAAELEHHVHAVEHKPVEVSRECGGMRKMRGVRGQVHRHGSSHVPAQPSQTVLWLLQHPRWPPTTPKRHHAFLTCHPCPRCSGCPCCGRCRRPSPAGKQLR